MFGRLLAVIHDIEEAMVGIQDFELLVQQAAVAGLFMVWPFRANTAAAKWYLPDLIHLASQMQRLEALFPYLEIIFTKGSTATMQPNQCFSLHELLSLLAEAYDLPGTPEKTKLGITRLMSQWGIMRLPLTDDVGVWSTQPHVSQIGEDDSEVVIWVVGALQKDRNPCCDCSPSAAVELVSVTPPSQPTNAPQVDHMPICCAYLARSCTDGSVVQAIRLKPL